MGVYLTIIRVLLLASLCWSGYAVADTATDVRWLLQQLAVDHLLRDVPEILQDSIAQRRKEIGLDSDEYARVKALYEQVYAPDGILDDMTQALAGKFREQDLRTLKNLLTTDEARKMITLRGAASSATGMQAVRELARSHQDNPLSKERQTLLESFDTQAADTEFFIAVQALAVYSIMRGFDTLSDKPEGMDDSEDSMLQMIYEQLERPSRFTVAMTLRYTFRDLKDQEVMDFIEIYRFGPLHQFLAAVMDELRGQMLRRAQQVRQKLCADKACAK